MKKNESTRHKTRNPKIQTAQGWIQKIAAERNAVKNKEDRALSSKRKENKKNAAE